MIPTAGGHTGIVASSFVFPEAEIGYSLPSIYLYPPQSIPGGYDIYGVGRVIGTVPKQELTKMPFPDGGKATNFITGGWGTLAIGTDGYLYAFYYDTDTIFRRVTGIPDGVRIKDATFDAPFSYFSAFVGDNDKVYVVCDILGKEYFGLTYTGTRIDNQAIADEVLGIPSGVAIMKIVSGYTFIIVLGDDGVAYGAGYNLVGQLTGTGTSSGTHDYYGDIYIKTSFEPLTGLPSGVTAIDIAVSSATTVVLGSDGILYGTGQGNILISNFNSAHNMVYAIYSTYGITYPDIVTTLTPFAKTLPTGVNPQEIKPSIYSTVILGDDDKLYGIGGTMTYRANDLGIALDFSNIDFYPYGAVSNNDTTLVIDDFTLINSTPSTPTVKTPASSFYTTWLADNANTLLISTDNKLYGCGYERYSEIGGTATIPSSTGSYYSDTLTEISLPTGVIPYSIGLGSGSASFGTVIIGNDGRVYGMGANSSYSLSGSSITTYSSFIEIAGLPSGSNAIKAAHTTSSTIVLAT